ncbi:MAG: hypothetical protein KF847_08985 [Pirellulales bacterium]|nr:hypothetical protein [Pirellulales bacterium]
MLVSSRSSIRLALAAAAAAPLLVVASWRSSLAAEPLVGMGPDGKLVYRVDELGNRVPDFSSCGYARSERPIPEAQVVLTVAPAEGDDGPRIQAALDFAGSPSDTTKGPRAVLLLPGDFEIAGQLRIPARTVLRGSGAGPGGTVLRATGADRRAVVAVLGRGEPELAGDPVAVRDEYVPVGATRLPLAASAALAVGDRVQVVRPSTAEWIAEIGADAFGVGWRPGSRDLRCERTVIAVDDVAIELDAPVTTALDPRRSGGYVQPFQWSKRIADVGVEDLTIEAVVDSDNPCDEDHAWYGVEIDRAENCWVRRVRFRKLAGGAVHLGTGTVRITVADCVSQEPVSEHAGYRRHTFFTLGQQGLFVRCWSEQGRHDFAIGHCAAGPNAFVNCFACKALDFSGPIESWASGALYDNVRIDGHDLCLQNNWAAPPGTGWSAANCLLWQCRAATVRCFRPPGAQNWSVGNWAVFAGDGVVESPSDFVKPQSLFQTQLAERVGRDAAEALEPFLGKPIGATNPTYAEAERFVAQSSVPARQLRDVIEENLATASNARSSRTAKGSRSLPQILAERSDFRVPKTIDAEASARPIRLANGWLVIGDGVLVGKRYSPPWWRGTMRADGAREFGPSVTRFAPGRSGPGLTDDVPTVAAQLAAAGYAAYDHHYGLWYDRRRDDHLMVRRADGAAAPPFYEQPFARTGRDAAWDGLSKYDLTRFNPWYWNRLRQLAGECDARGTLLIHQHYFQHNILEAGAHWVDSPWRPANNVNDADLPEPPPYIGDKRIFVAHEFYDPANESLRRLHRGYVRQCLDAFADRSNVVHSIGAEYTGPREFVEFWLDEIAAWQRENERDALVGLACTKDVQDAILADKARREIVDVIDVRYWCYDKNLNLYAPPGGVNLSPRQHLRQLRPEAGSFAAIVKAVSETRTQHPDKAVTFFAGENCRTGEDGWAVLVGGGSLADVPLSPDLAAAVVAMRPAPGAVDGGWALGDGKNRWLICLDPAGKQTSVRGLRSRGRYRATWIDERTGATTRSDDLLVSPTGTLTLPRRGRVCRLELLGP